MLPSSFLSCGGVLLSPPLCELLSFFLSSPEYPDLGRSKSRRSFSLNILGSLCPERWENRSAFRRRHRHELSFPTTRKEWREKKVTHRNRRVLSCSTISLDSLSASIFSRVQGLFLFILPVHLSPFPLYDLASLISLWQSICWSSLTRKDS